MVIGAFCLPEMKWNVLSLHAHGLGEMVMTAVLPFLSMLIHFCVLAVTQSADPKTFISNFPPSFPHSALDTDNFRGSV
jgi:hypothetical protein